MTLLDFWVVYVFLKPGFSRCRNPVILLDLVDFWFVEDEEDARQRFVDSIGKAIFASPRPFSLRFDTENVFDGLRSVLGMLVTGIDSRPLSSGGHFV